MNLYIVIEHGPRDVVEAFEDAVKEVFLEEDDAGEYIIDEANKEIKSSNQTSHHSEQLASVTGLDEAVDYFGDQGNSMLSIVNLELSDELLNRMLSRMTYHGKQTAPMVVVDVPTDKVA